MALFQLQKDAMRCLEQILEAAPPKSGYMVFCLANYPR